MKEMIYRTKKQILSMVKEFLNLETEEDSEMFLQKIDDMIKCICNKDIDTLYDVNIES